MRSTTDLINELFEAADGTVQAGIVLHPNQRGAGEVNIVWADDEEPLDELHRYMDAGEAPVGLLIFRDFNLRPVIRPFAEFIGPARVTSVEDSRAALEFLHAVRKQYRSIVYG